MNDDDDHYHDQIAAEDPSFRTHTDITSDELTTALRSLALLGGDMYLGMQVTNITVIDQFIMDVEYETLQELLRTERTPAQTMFLNAQSQMWIFAVYELLRTWRARAKDVIKLAESGGLVQKAEGLEADQGFLHSGRAQRAQQLREIAQDPSIIEAIKTDLRRVHIPFARIEHLRVSLAKHEVRGKRNSVAYSPGYGRIHMTNGSLQYQLENGPIILDTISRRDIADELRALNNPSTLPSDETNASFDAFMKTSLGDLPGP
jgi:hypothetical protein